jgi:hypothetical protein
MNLTHPLNVNHKYTAFFTILENQYVGESIRKTNAYSTRLSREEWQRKKEEFWETRTEGKQECWQAIRMACETDNCKKL